MSEQRSLQHGTLRRATTPFQRAYLATLTRRLFGRRLFSPGPGALSHAVAVRIAQMQRPTRRR
jgi:hypothetical protein